MAGGGWTSLPAEILAEVFSRLQGDHHGDANQTRISQVCSHWRACTPPLAVRRPWIVAGGKPWSPTGPIGDEYSFWTLPRGGHRIHLHTSPPAGLPYCRGTHRGWLALSDHRRNPTRVVLWEPLSGTEIPLPCLRAVSQVFLSGDPLASPEDWTAVAIQEILPQVQRLHFWRPGHAAWTTQLGINTLLNRIHSVAFHGGELYFTTSVGTVHICDLQGFPPKLVRNIRICPVIADIEGWRVVSCKEEVLLVAVRSVAPGRPFVAEVYRPDWAAERPELLRERVTDLGECSLFLGRRDGFALSADEFPAITRNRIYYVQVEDTTDEHTTVVFELGSNVSQRIPCPGERGGNLNRRPRRGGNQRGSNRNWCEYSWFCPRRPILKQ